jgi:hypothetical protein
VEKVIAISVLGFVGLVGGCNITTNAQDNQAVIDLVQKGVNPLDAKCAIRTEASASFCVILAAKKTNKE